MSVITINPERLRKDISDLSEIGRYEDQGIYRMAFTDADMEAREWLKQRIRDAGMEPYSDGAANVFARLDQSNANPCVLMGSHIDTVPGAGHLDGALGVLTALECLRRIQEEKIETRHPVEMAAFTDEEGRFGGMFGSQAVCGFLNPDMILNSCDLNGVLIKDEMAKHGLNAMDALQARRNPQSIHSYLEIHIEQGPVLDRLKLDAGVVSEITGLFKWSVRLIGAPDHAGTTPMPMRRDAFMGLAEFTSEIDRVLEENGGENSVATIGKVELYPGSANTVPGRVEFSLDVRDTQKEVLAELALAFRKALSAIARRRSLMFEFDILSEIAPAQCDPNIVHFISQASEKLSLKSQVMPSGAAHDAQIMSRITRTGMIFVPSVGGRSHSAAEWTHWEHIEKGANLALNSLIRIAEGNGASTNGKDNNERQERRPENHPVAR